MEVVGHLRAADPGCFTYVVDLRAVHAALEDESGCHLQEALLRRLTLPGQARRGRARRGHDHQISHPGSADPYAGREVGHILQEWVCNPITEALVFGTTDPNREDFMAAPVVLITGALTGIGRATAEAFARDGASG